MVENLPSLIDIVQKNCTIADARHARVAVGVAGAKLALEVFLPRNSRGR